mgnify:CR=1 FL=1
MVGFRKREREEEAEIPTASMADIAFLLIIFFMVTTVFAREKGLKLLLPERQAQTVKLSGEKMLVLSINPRGEIFADNEKITLQEVQTEVNKKLEENPKAVIFIRTHELAPYKRMIDVFDEVKMTGAKAVSLGVIKQEAGP